MKPAFFLFSLLAAGCPDYGFQGEEPFASEGAPAIEVEPRTLDFWQVRAGEEQRLTFTVRNVGESAVDVDELVVDSPTGAFSLVDGGAGFLLEAGEWRDVEVSFLPAVPSSDTGTVTVVSTDEDEPAIPVALLGEGRMPWLQITPEDWDFGVVPIGCPAALVLTLQNVGNDDLRIGGFTYTGDPSLAVLETSLATEILGPGRWALLNVAFDPVAEGLATGVLTVASDDPRGDRTATQAGEGAEADRVTDRFDVPDDPPVDVLFAVDQSLSMGDDAASLGANFGTFLPALQAETTAWHVGVATLDSGCFNGGPLTCATPGVEMVFEEAVQYGEDEEILNDEALFRIVDRAISAFEDGRCNAGFRREEALLHVIVVSDEPERSTEEAAAWTWAFWLDRWLAAVAAPERFRISGILDTDGCNEGAEGYLEAIAATGGIALSICAGDWAEDMAALADATLHGLYAFPLSRTPVADTLEVRVDGAPFAGWTYDETTNEVVVDALGGGLLVEISYVAAEECGDA